MSQSVKVFSVVALLCLFGGSALAQTSNFTVPSCADADSIAINATLAVGVWYESARNPAPTNLGCVETNVTLSADNSTLILNTTFSITPNSWWENNTSIIYVPLVTNSSAGYNASTLTNGQNKTSALTYKLLNADYNDHLIICGFSNATNSSVGIILTRARAVSTATITTLNNTAANYSTAFNASTGALYQSVSCYYKSGATTSVPVLSAILAAIYALLKYVN